MHRLLWNRDQLLRCVNMHFHLDKHAAKERSRRLRRQSGQRLAVGVERFHFGRFGHKHATGQRASFFVQSAALLPRERALPAVAVRAELKNHRDRRRGDVVGIGIDGVCCIVCLGGQILRSPTWLTLRYVTATPDSSHFIHSQAGLYLSSARVFKRDKRRALGDKRVLLNSVIDDNAISRSDDLGARKI